MLIRTRVGPSGIHGVGVFACEAAAAGVAVWRFEPAFDRIVEEAEITDAPAAFRDFLAMYAYRALDLGSRWGLPCDHARFLNHSHDPNTEERPMLSLARRPIAVGDEITCDYGSFCAGWEGFG